MSICLPRRHCLRAVVGVLLLLLSGNAWAREKPKERDLYDIEAQQKAPANIRKIVFIADTDPHGGRGNHEFVGGAIYLARTINAQYPNAWAVVTTKQKFPKNLNHADAIIVLMNNGGPAAVNPAVVKAVERGAGFMAIHYAVEVDKGVQGQNYQKWIGGCFETFWSVTTTWTAEFKDLPTHEVTRGVKPFTLKDEWYYHMRFVDDMKGVTPILSALPPLTSMQNEGKAISERSGTPTVWDEVSKGKKQVVAWTYDRPGGGRGFGFTGYHTHANLGNDSFRTVLLNAVAWVSKLEVPKEGVPSKTLTREELEALIDEGKLAVKNKGI